MAVKKHFLKSHVIIEPLINNWYAWSHLVAPITSAALINHRYLPILNSFLQHPTTHQKVFLEKKFSAGPYVNLSTAEVPDIRSLLDNLLKQNQDNFKLITDYVQLNKQLIDQNAGFSLEKFYAMVPSSLAGCVELVYDLNHQPNIRLLEPLLYQRYYTSKSQSLYLTLAKPQERPYILSTPRLNNLNSCLLSIPFNDSRWQSLIQMRDQPGNIAELMQVAVDNNIDPKLFADFFTSELPATKFVPQKNTHPIQIKYFGHACILIQTPTLTILIDPLIQYQSDVATTYTYADLPDVIDYVLITHAHQDHCSLETLLQIKEKIKHILVPASNHGFLADPSLKLVLAHCGFTNITEVQPFDEIPLACGRIIALPFLGEHGDLDIRSKVAYYLKLEQDSFLFAADSNNLDPQLYKNLQQYLGEITNLFIGMECVGAPYSWTYDHILINKPTRTADQSRRLNGSDAAKVIDMIHALKPKRVITYAMGLEPDLHYILGLALTAESPQLCQAELLKKYCFEHKIEYFQPYLKHMWGW